MWEWQSLLQITHMCVVVGRMELLPSFLRARLSAAAVISLSSPVFEVLLEDNSYKSQHIEISAVLYIWAAILDYGDRIATSTSEMVSQPLIIRKKWY